MTRRGLALTVLLTSAAAASPAAAAPLPVSGTLDLADAPASQAVRWTGSEKGALAGGAVAGIGDFDGDGRRDVAVGEPKRDTAAGADSGVVHILLDARAGGTLDDAARTITIRGAGPRDFAGFDVAAAGDVNGDGLGDVLVGAPVAGPGDTQAERPGAAYLVYGRRGRNPIDLAGDFGGLRITGTQPGAFLGRSVTSLPDVTGDGRPELVVGAPRQDVRDRTDAGAAHVVFGRIAGDVDVDSLVEDGAGLRIDGPAGPGGALAGRAVGSIGDLDGDQLPEVLVTAPRAPTNAPGSKPNGRAYVVHGRATPGNVDLETLGDDGFVITGGAARTTDDTAEKPGNFLGEAIAGVGDVNGDGRPDLAVGAHLADAPDRPRGGLVHVVFGKADTAPVDVDQLGDGGYRITGVGSDDSTGLSVAPAGDINADGLPDITLGAPLGDPLSRPTAGAAYVVYGRRGTQAEVDLAEIGDRGLRVAGVDGEAAGFAVDGVGDVSGDGGDDLAIGAVNIDPDYLFTLRSDKPGSAAIVFGASGAKDIPGGEITSDPGYREAVAAGCTPATNVQAVLDDDDYNDRRADPGRLRLEGMQAYVGTPRNFGTVLGVTGFGPAGGDGEADEEEYPATPIIEPAELTAGRADLFKGALFKGIKGDDDFPGYDRMFRTLADDNPSAGARIMVIDGYTFRSVRALRGLTEGSAPTYIVAIGEPPERTKSDIAQMKRVTRETKGRYYEARSARQLERALQAIQSRIRCDIEADLYQENLQPGDQEEEVAETELEEDVQSADVTVTWRDEDDDYEIDQVDILDEDGEDVIRRYDDEDIEEAYDERDEDAPVTAGRGRTFRALHLRGLRAGRLLRVTLRADDRRTGGRVYTRVTQNRSRR